MHTAVAVADLEGSRVHVEGAPHQRHEDAYRRFVFAARAGCGHRQGLCQKGVAPASAGMA